MFGPNKVIYNTVLDHGLLILDGSQHAPEEELRIFWNINSVYNATRLNPSGCLAPNVAMQGEKNLKLQWQSYSQI